ncbi:MAG: VOC family protein [Cyanobacteria bacterium REEB459]|nr:VOC family protein [Cyanobacteria bacterium REEB459]
MHHSSIRTQDIHRAMAFYEGLGFAVEVRFTTGMTLACWLQGLGTRLELIQVPAPRSAADAFEDEHYTGYYHLSFDLSDQVTGLSDWLDQLREQFRTSDRPFTLKVLLEPCQQIIGDRVYEVTFLADADGLPLEFLRQLGPLQR